METNFEARRQIELETYVKEAIITTDLTKSKFYFDKLDYFGEEECAVYGRGNYYILTLNGGLNGRGRILFYMEDAIQIIKRLMCRFTDVWLVSWENDCPDDVFELKLGLRL